MSDASEIWSSRKKTATFLLNKLKEDKDSKRLWREIYNHCLSLFIPNVDYIEELIEDYSDCLNEETVVEKQVTQHKTTLLDLLSRLDYILIGVENELIVYTEEFINSLTNGIGNSHSCDSGYGSENVNTNSDRGSDSCEFIAANTVLQLVEKIYSQLIEIAENEDYVTRINVKRGISLIKRSLKKFDLSKSVVNSMKITINEKLLNNFNEDKSLYVEKYLKIIELICEDDVVITTKMCKVLLKHVQENSDVQKCMNLEYSHFCNLFYLMSMLKKLLISVYEELKRSRGKKSDEVFKSVTNDSSEKQMNRALLKVYRRFEKQLTSSISSVQKYFHMTHVSVVLQQCFTNVSKIVQFLQVLIR